MLARYTLLVLTGLFLLWALVAGAQWAMRFQEAVILPSGMQLGREFGWNRYGRWDLFATNGQTRLAREVEFVCFNDRYVFVKSYDCAFNGLYDATTNRRTIANYSEATDLVVLGQPGRNCNGYYTNWLGPGLLLDDASAPLLPPFEWRNFGNPSLKDKRWFDRPRDPKPISVR